MRIISRRVDDPRLRRTMSDVARTMRQATSLNARELTVRLSTDALTSYVITLPATPKLASVTATRNGNALSGFTTVGRTVTFPAALTLKEGDTLVVAYTVDSK